MSKFVYEPGEVLLHDGNSDECPGKWDPPGHRKLKANELCGYCSLKERIEQWKVGKRWPYF
jgi:hypothetical protein